jgi:predicted permease
MTRDWPREVRAQGRAAGIELPPATVDEISQHLDEIFAAALRDGCSDAEAGARARAALEESTLEILGGVAASEPMTGRSLNTAGALRLAVRQLRLRPGFAAITILVLALGIGASTTVFTVVDSVVLRPLPYAEPDRLVTLWDVNSGQGLAHEPISPVNFMDYRALPVFEGAAAWWRPSLNLVDPGLDPVRVNAIEVSGNIFDVLGIRPQIGEGFPVGGPFYVQREPLVVISDRLWRARYDADPSIVGRLLRFNGIPHTVAGVMPPRFHYPDDVDVWQRTNWDYTRHTRAAHFMESVLRLADGVTPEQAAIAAATLGRRLENEFAQTNKGWAPKLVPLLEEQLGYYRPALFVLIGAVGLVLLIGCLNVASLLLTRALSREREVAVRVAIGASPRQLVVQLLAESLVLSCAGAIAGVLAAAVALPALVSLAPEGIPRLDEARLSLRALGPIVGLVALTTVVFGLVPALVLLRRGSVELRSGERGSSRGARRAYSVLVAGQVALACTLLASSALLIRTVEKMVSTPTGVDAGGVVTTTVQLAAVAYPKWQSVAETHAAILAQIRQQPGVTAAGAGNFLPFEVGWRMPYQVEGQALPTRPEDRPIAQFHTVTDGYFEAMRAPVAAGRFFSPFDTTDSAGVVVVNEAFAARHFPAGQSVIGQRVSTAIGAAGPLGVNLKVSPGLVIGQPPPPPRTATFEIVGVVRDIRNAPLGQAVEPAIYFGSQQFPFRELFLTVRASDTGAAVAAVRQALAAVTPNVPMGIVRTWGDRMAARTAEPRLLMVLLMFFGAAAALLAALGIYGLFSWSVAQRTRELAIRLTLGARPMSVGASVVRQSLALIAVGLVVGLGIVRVAEGALSLVLFELSPRDPASLLAASGLLIVVALAACVPPALRALRVDPVDGLRAE